MTFKFYCTCGQKVSATDDMIGLAAVCPRCGTQIIVSAPSENEGEPEPPPPPPPPLPAAEAPSHPAPTASLAPAPPPPLSVVPRPMRLLWLFGSGALAAVLITGAVMFRMRWDLWLKELLPVFGLVIVGGAFAALFLRLTIRIIAHFDLAYLEAWLISLVAGSCGVLAMAPIQTVQPGKGGADFVVQILPITNAISVVLVIVAYSLLIRNPQGRPIGFLRGALSALLQLIFLGLILGLIGGLGAFFWYTSRVQPG